MRTLRNLLVFAAIIFVFAAMGRAYAGQGQSPKDELPYLFIGEVNSDDINLRSDSTTNSQIIFKLNRGENIEVLGQLYDWYKVKLPSNAPSFIKREMVSMIEGKTDEAKVIKDAVNVRLKPNISSPILGKLKQDDLIKIVGQEEDWYKIEPVKNSFGWIHKSLINKTEKKAVKQAKKEEKEEPALQPNTQITVEGLLKPKIFTRVASHKIVDNKNKVHLLRGDKENLDSLSLRQVRLTGQVIDDPSQDDPIIQVEKIEALD